MEPRYKPAVHIYDFKCSLARCSVHTRINLPQLLIIIRSFGDPGLPVRVRKAVNAGKDGQEEGQDGQQAQDKQYADTADRGAAVSDFVDLGLAVVKHHRAVVIRGAKWGIFSMWVVLLTGLACFHCFSL